MRWIPVFLFLTASLIAAGDPWNAGEVVRPEVVAKDVATPLMLQVGFDVLYRAAHVAGSIYAGPASKPEGIEALKQAVAGQPKNREIILYCGCCPWEKCPNIRPAFAALRELGFTRVKVMIVPENLKADWIDKGYPTDRRAAQ